MKTTSAVRLLLGSALLSMAGMASANNLAETSTIGTSTSYQYYNTGGTAYSSVGAYGPGHQISDSTAGTSFLAYCIDPLTSAANTSTGNYSTTTLANFLNGSAAGASPYVAPTYANQIARTSTYGTLGVTATSTQQALVLADLQDLYSWAYTAYVTNGSADQRAAFGYALWEIIMQNGGAAGTTYGASTGTLRVYGSNTAATDGVDTALSNLLGALNNTTSAGWTSLGLTQTTNWVYTVYYDTTTPYTQTYLTVSAGGTPPPGAPEPGSLALAAVALAAVGVARRKARR